VCSRCPREPWSRSSDIRTTLSRAPASPICVAYRRVTFVFIPRGGRPFGTWSVGSRCAPGRNEPGRSGNVSMLPDIRPIESRFRQRLDIGPTFTGNRRARYGRARPTWLLRLVGRRQHARKIIKSLNAGRNYPYPIVHMALIASALLSIDEGKFADARACLSESATVLGRNSSWNSDDLERRRLLAEVMRETARTYLEEASTFEDDDRALNWLEVAWLVYQGTLAVVAETEDLLSHAWIHENLGILSATYAKRSRNPGHTPECPRLPIDYPALYPLRGNTAKLLELS
jgi:hypothetical protein